MSTAEKMEIGIKMRTLIRADINRVYDAIATPEGLDAWFTTGATVEPYPGGEMTFRWKDWGVDHVNAVELGRVLEANRPNRFVFEWGIDKEWGPSTIEFDFEETDEGTVVEVRDHGHANTRLGWETCVECASGWGEAVTLMKFYLEHGIRYFGESKTLPQI